jgi:hypothetical protein
MADKNPREREVRVFDPKIRKELEDIHAGKVGGKTTGGKDAAEDAAYAAGGSAPSRFYRAAKKGKTSVPKKRKK